MKSTSFFLAALLFSLPAAQGARVLDHASPTQGNLGTGGGAYPVMTPNGRFVAFQSPSSFLLPTGEDTNGSSDIFVFDRSNQTIERVSVRSDGSQQTGNSQNPSISEDGRYVCFISEAALDASDTNGFSDACVHDRRRRLPLLGDPRSPGARTRRPSALNQAEFFSMNSRTAFASASRG